MNDRQSTTATTVEMITGSNPIPAIDAAMASSVEHGPVYARLIAAVFENTGTFIRDEFARGTRPDLIIFAVRDMYVSNIASLVAHSGLPGQEKQLAEIIGKSTAEALGRAIALVTAHRGQQT